MSNEAAQARCRRSARLDRCCCPAPCPQYTKRLRCLRASERAVPAMPGAPTDPCTGKHTNFPSTTLKGTVCCLALYMKPLDSLLGIYCRK